MTLNIVETIILREPQLSEETILSTVFNTTPLAALARSDIFVFKALISTFMRNANLEMRCSSVTFPAGLVAQVV